MNAKKIIVFIISIFISFFLGCGVTAILIYKTPLGGISNIIEQSRKNDELNRKLKKGILEQRSTIERLNETISNYEKLNGELQESIANSDNAVQRINESIKRDYDIIQQLDELNNANKKRLAKYKP